MKYTFLNSQTLGQALYTAPELCVYEAPVEQGFLVTDSANNDYDNDENLGDLD